MVHRSSVVVSRQWHHPEITVAVTSADISITIKLADFLTAVVEETGHPTFLMTKAQLEKALIASAEKVVTSMKGETARVI